MGACVIDTLEETDSGNEAARTGCKPYPQFDRQSLIHVWCSRPRCTRPNCARTIACIEHDIDPVVRGLEGTGRKCAAATVIVNATVLQRLKRRIVYCCIEIVSVNSKISRRTKVRCNIYRVSRDGHRRREVHLLP